MTEKEEFINHKWQANICTKCKIERIIFSKKMQTKTLYILKTFSDETFTGTLKRPNCIK